MRLHETLLISVFSCFRRVFYNTPLRHWRVTTFVYRRMARLLSGSSTQGVHGVTFRGLSLYVRSSDTVMIAALAAQKYEQGMIHAFMERIAQIRSGISPDEKSLMVDVGANIGVYSLLALQGNPDMEVHSIEANLETVRLLRRNCVANRLSGIHIHPVAAGHISRAVRLDISSELSGTHHIGDLQEGVPVDMWRLDDLLARRDGVIRIIKVDVEGYEPFVLEGAHEIIRRDKPTVFMEFISMNLKRYHVDPSVFLDQLLTMFPFVYYIDEVFMRIKLLNRQDVAQVDRLISIGGNLLLTHDA